MAIFGIGGNADPFAGIADYLGKFGAGSTDPNAPATPFQEYQLGGQQSYINNILGHLFGGTPTVGAVTSGTSTAAGISKFFSNITSANFGERIVFIILGLLMIAFSLYAFVHHETINVAVPK
jgi:hypothetical protein